MADVEDLFVRKDAEDDVCWWLAAFDCGYARSYEILFPGRNYTDAQIKKMLVANKIDGYMLITYENRVLIEDYTQIDYEPFDTVETEIYTDTITYDETTVNSIDDESIDQIYFTGYKAVLIDVRTSRIAWTSYTRVWTPYERTISEGYDDQQWLSSESESLSEDIVRNLYKDGMIFYPKPKKNVPEIIGESK